MSSFKFVIPSTPGLVSVVIPVRNGAKYIGATLSSIGAQTYGFWEVVVVEDGTDDGTQQIVRDFAKKHPHNRVVYARNETSQGAGATRNAAFEHTAGEFVALLDSDDRWTPDHLEVSVGTLGSGGQDIVYSTVVMVEDGTEQILGMWGPTHQELQEFPQSLFNRSFVTPSATVLRRQVLADVGHWSTTHRYCEDYDYWVRCIAAGKSFGHIGGSHCLYRKNHPTSTTYRLSGLLEEVALTTEHHLHLPRMKSKKSRRYAAQAFLMAARFHRKSDPKKDPSANPLRAGLLLLKGWRLYPRKVRMLFKGLGLALAAGLPFRKRRDCTPPPNPYGSTASTSSAPAVKRAA